MTKLLTLAAACLTSSMFLIPHANGQKAKAPNSPTMINSSCPNWSAKFDSVDDLQMMQVLLSHRDAGWDAVIAEGEKVGAALTQQIADGEQQLTISRDAEQRARAGLALPKHRAEPDGKADCSSAESQEKNFACQVQIRHHEVLALEGMLDLLRCRLPSHPAVPSRPEGTVIATYYVKVVPESGAQRRGSADPCQCDEQRLYAHALTLGIKQSGQRVEVKQGSYIVLRLEPTEHASGFTVEPDQEILQFNTGRVFLPKDVIGILNAKKVGESKIMVYGKPSPPVSNKQTETAGDRTKFTSFNNNWSGYVLPFAPFEFIRGEWTVPTVEWTLGGQISVWAGIDGFGTNQLIQAGVADGYSTGFLGIGAGSYHYAWWEVLPAFETQISNPVMAGDRMTVTISPFPPGSSASPDVMSIWMITIKNLTSGWTFSIPVSYMGNLSSAEWIVEDPETCFLGCWFDSMPQFSNVTFDVGNMVSSGTGAAMPPMFATVEPLGIRQDQGILASPSSPDCDGEGFTVEEGGNTPPAPGPWTDPIAFPSAVLPSGSAGTPYISHLRFKDLLPPFSQSVTVTSGSLPPGLALDPSTGTLSGTPTKEGNFSFSVTGADLSTKDDMGAMATCTVPVSLNIFQPLPRARCYYSTTLKKFVCF